jgi:hypothetical protein
MKLTPKQIKQILLERPTRRIWEQAVKDTNKLQTHVLGHNIDNYVEKIDGFESPKALAVRKKYCKTNRDLFARALRPVDNIWNGRGGGKVFLTNEANQKRLREMCLDVYKGKSLQDWVETYWLPRYKDDPMGLIFMEVDEQAPDGVYPTYKSSREVHEALVSGRRLEWVFFKTAEPQVFRLVDDEKDVMVKLDGDGDDRTVRILQGKDYPRFINWFDQVPAILVSDIPKDGREGQFTSPIWDEMELADQYLRDGSIANVYRFRNGFPRTWKYPEVCGNCKGQKVLDGKTCGSCNGSGIKLASEPGDTTVYAWPTKDEPEIKDKGGFISPDLDYLKYADESQELLEELIMRTHWGTYMQRPGEKKGDADTAEKVRNDAQPVINRLTKYAKAAESIQEFIVDHKAALNLRNSYKGCSINLGRRFMLELPDAIWLKYENARSKGAPQASLDDLLRDYYESKYQGNELELEKFLVLARLEPGVHLTIAEVKANLPWIEYAKKVYFQAFLATKSDIQLTTTPLPILIKELEAFATAQAAEAPQDPMAPKLDENNNPIPPKKEPVLV